MKNLEFALRSLAPVRCPVVFDIYGPLEDATYWTTCLTLMKELPPSVSVHYHGPVEHDEVDEVLQAHDLFLFPTRGENFGHAIFESMRAGTPVLIADTTPWRNLEALGVGWDLPLSDPDAFGAAVEAASAVEGSAYLEWRKRVQAYALVMSADPAVVEASRRLFQGASATK